MDLVQQYSQFMLLQSLAAANSMPSMINPINPSINGTASPSSQASPVVNPSGSPQSPTTSTMPLLDDFYMKAFTLNLEKLLSAPQAIKTELLPPASKSQPSTPSSAKSPYALGYPSGLPAREYKVHVNRQSARPLQEWMDENISHPYPASSDMQELAFKTGFSHRQIRNWFTNNRRRYEQKCVAEGKPLPWVKKEAPGNTNTPRKSPSPSYEEKLLSWVKKEVSENTSPSHE